MIARIASVSKSYRADVPALIDIDLDVAPHRFTMIVGPSGSGKTTLLNLIGCVDTPDTGTIEVAGQDVSRLPDRAATAFRSERIGFIFQSFNLIPVLTAFENVEYALLKQSIHRSERAGRVEEILRVVGLWDVRDRIPGMLSGGQRQRVAIARALVKRPAIVLADEPTANLDIGNGTAMVKLMREMQARYDTTFIFSTHDVALMEHADTLVSMRDGRLVKVEVR